MGAEGTQVEEFVTRSIARQPETIVWSGLGCLRGTVGWSRGLGVAKLGRVAVGVLFVMTRRVITIQLRRTEAYLPRQVRLGRWAWWLEWGDFGGEGEVREYATDCELDYFPGVMPLPKSPMGKALGYALRLETALRQFLNDGRLEMENNAAERALRAVAIGRNNWTFFQNEGGGKTAVILLSLVMTAKAIGINPQTYLRDIQSRLAHETDVRKLTPHGWKEHFAEQVEYERRVVVASFAQV